MDYTYYTGTWRDVLTSYDGNNISHAGIGNLQSDRLWTYTWEHGRELSSMTWRGASIPGYKTETEGETKNGLYLDSDGEVRYYVDGEAIYAGLIYWEGYYYYINSSKKAVQNVTYTTSTTNGLLPIAAYTFDEYGRMTNPPDGSYGRLAGTEDVTISYQYDANGMRTGKTVTRTDKTTGTQTVHAYAYIYNGSQLSQMTVDGHTLRFSYDSGKPMFVKYDGVTYQYILNLQGDVIGIMNHAGTVVVEYVYDAWGNILSITGSHASTVGRYNPLRYRSYVFDQETGLYYLQSRYYNPEWGRFINADSAVSTGQGFIGNNMFAYCGNNPVRYSDPSGNAFVEALIVAVGAEWALTIVICGTVVVCNFVFSLLEELLDWLSKQWYRPFAQISYAEEEQEETLPQQGLVEGDSDAPPVDAGKQGKHVQGHNNYVPDKSSWPEGKNGVSQTQEAWKNGVQDPKKPIGQAKIGIASDGTVVRVHIDGDGSIHGYPLFPAWWPW